MSEQLNVAIETARLLDLDQRTRIIGSFLIQRTPSIQHEVSRQMEEACVGVELPVRFPHLLEYDYVSIEHADLIASLILQSCESEANHFNAYVAGKGWPYKKVNWGFNATSGLDILDSAVSTDAYYKYLELRYR
jgi:hypothetical protein